MCARGGDHARRLRGGGSQAPDACRSAPPLRLLRLRRKEVRVWGAIRLQPPWSQTSAPPPPSSPEVPPRAARPPLRQGPAGKHRAMGEEAELDVDRHRWEQLRFRTGRRRAARDGRELRMSSTSGSRLSSRTSPLSSRSRMPRSCSTSLFFKEDHCSPTTVKPRSSSFFKENHQICVDTHHIIFSDSKQEELIPLQGASAD